MAGLAASDRPKNINHRMSDPQTGRKRTTVSSSRPRDIADKLTRRIQSGEFPAGSQLPPERDLAAAFGTTRNVIREALTRLDALGLVTIRPGAGVYTNDLTIAASIDLFEALSTQEDGSLNLSYLRDVIEFRLYFVRLVGRLAAARRTEEEYERIQTLVEQRRASMDNPERYHDITLAVFREIVHATHNQVCLMMFHAFEHIDDQLRGLLDVPVIGFERGQIVLERLLEALKERDAEMAELITMRYAEMVQKALSPE